LPIRNSHLPVRDGTQPASVPCVDGKLNILARIIRRGGDQVGEDSLAMSDRRDYLARILRVLASDKVDGLMATMDILEDLLAMPRLDPRSRRRGLARWQCC